MAHLFKDNSLTRQYAAGSSSDLIMQAAQWQEQIRRVDQDGRRHYEVMGRHLPSVTTVLSATIPKPALLSWAVSMTLESAEAELRPGRWSRAAIHEVMRRARRVPDALRDDAGRFGTETHRLIDAIVQGQKVAIPDAQELVIQRFRKWRALSGFDIRLGETRVWCSCDPGYAGGMDSLGMATDIDERLVVFDWKTGNHIFDDAAYQVAAYAHALGCMAGEPDAIRKGLFSGAWVVRLGKEKDGPEFEARQIDLVPAWQTWRDLLNAYYSRMATPWIKRK